MLRHERRSVRGALRAPSGLPGAARTGLGGRPRSEYLGGAVGRRYIRHHPGDGFGARLVRDGDGLSATRCRAIAGPGRVTLQ